MGKPREGVHRSDVRFCAASRRRTATDIDFRLRFGGAFFLAQTHMNADLERLIALQKLDSTADAATSRRSFLPGVDL